MLHWIVFFYGAGCLWVLFLWFATTAWDWRRRPRRCVGYAALSLVSLFLFSTLAYGGIISWI